MIPEPTTGPILAIFAHPDDAEISSGATLARWCDAGREVHLLVLTNGDRGSGDPAQDRAELAAIRGREVAAAASVLGLAGTRIVGVHDGDLENTPAIRAEVAREIRVVRPDIVLTCDPTSWFMEDRYFNHRDHRKAGEIALDGTFPAAGNPHFFTEELAGLTPWDPPQVWMSWSNDPNHTEDVTGYVERKLAALRCHESQVGGDGIRFFDEWLPRQAEEAGKRIGAAHGESFRVLQLT